MCEKHIFPGGGVAHGPFNLKFASDQEGVLTKVNPYPCNPLATITVHIVKQGSRKSSSQKYLFKNLQLKSLSESSYNSAQTQKRNSSLSLLKIQVY